MLLFGVDRENFIFT